MTNSILQVKVLFQKYYDNEVLIAKNANNNKNLALLKTEYFYTYDVFKTTYYILKRNKILSRLPNRFKNFLKICTLLHRIGILQEINNPENGIKSKGIYVAENILKKLENETNPFILLPIKYYDVANGEELIKKDMEQYNLLDQEKEVMIFILKLIKDGDKLSKLILVKSNSDTALIKDKKIGFSQKCLEDFQNRKKIKKEDVQTIFDELLLYISYMYGFNFSTSKDFFLKLDFITFALVKMNKLIKEIDDTNQKNEIFENELNNIKNQLENDIVNFDNYII